jgi:hypothetical protein
VKFGLSQAFLARNECIVLAGFSVFSRRRSAAFPVDASSWNVVPVPTVLSIAFIIAFIIVVFPVPAPPEITERGWKNAFAALALLAVQRLVYIPPRLWKSLVRCMNVEVLFVCLNSTFIRHFTALFWPIASTSNEGELIVITKGVGT